MSSVLIRYSARPTPVGNSALGDDASTPCVCAVIFLLAGLEATTPPCGAQPPKATQPRATAAVLKKPLSSLVHTEVPRYSIPERFPIVFVDLRFRIQSLGDSGRALITENRVRSNLQEV